MKRLLLIPWLCLPINPALAADEITITGLIGDKVLIQIDGKNHIIPEGESSPEGVKIVEIDHDKRRVILDINGEEKTYPLDISGRRGSSSIKIAPDRSGMYRASGKINQVPTEYIIDTGATFVSLNRKFAGKLGLDYKNSPQKGMAETASGKVPVYLVTLDEVEVNGLRLKNVPAVVNDSNYPTVVLLGMSFLKHLDIRRVGSVLHLNRR